MSGPSNVGSSSSVFSPWRCAACDAALRGIGVGACPVTLSCGHTICRACGDAISSGSKCACPLCYAEVSLPLVANVGVGVVGEAACVGAEVGFGGPAEALLCADCLSLDDSVLASHKCMTCGERGLCEPHHTFHARKKHDLVVVSPSGIAPASRCVLHSDSALYFYCVSDMTAVCRDCLALGHPRDSHDVRELSSVEDVVCASLRERVSLFRAAADAMVCRAGALERAIAGVSASEDACCARVTEVHDDVKAAVDANCVSVLRRVHDVCEGRRKRLRAQGDVLGVGSGQLGLGALMCESALSSGNVLKMAETLSSVKLMDALARRDGDGDGEGAAARTDDDRADSWCELWSDTALVSDALKSMCVIREVCGVCMRCICQIETVWLC